MTKGILSGKHALVTGGLGSIGLALVAGFAAAGARVTVLDRPDLTPLEGHGWLGVDLNDLSAAQAKVAAAGVQHGRAHRAGATDADLPAPIPNADAVPLPPDLGYWPPMLPVRRLL
jgi:NAD(P)-dependent dehydrogenase (short-subunit alcohol dehydrogenase family)